MHDNSLGNSLEINVVAKGIGSIHAKGTDKHLICGCSDTMPVVYHQCWPWL